ncbi:MAG: O-antigen ligase family protein [Huintestinicola sp.]
MKIFEKQWALTLLLLPFFKLPIFEYIGSLRLIDSLFDMAKIVSFGVIILIYINGKKISPIIISIILYQLSLFLSTAINKGDYWKLAVNCGTMIGFCMVTELALKKNSRLYFKTVLNIFIPLAVINFLVIKLFPDGLVRDDFYRNAYYILGHRNSIPAVLIPLMIYGFVYSSVKGKKITSETLILIAAASASIFITWSATGVAGLFMLLFFALFIYREKIAGSFNSFNLSVLYAAAFLGIIVFRIQSAFSFIIEDLLHKNITFTGRTDIWDIAIMMIKRSPVFGYGVYEGHGLVFTRGQYYYAHNAVLEVLLQGGVISLIFYAAIFGTAAAALYKNRHYAVSQILAFGIFTIHVMMLMEAYSNIWIFALPVIACHVPEISAQSDNLSDNSALTVNSISLRRRYILYRLKQR